MKKNYQVPVAERVTFDYSENVTASNTYGPWEVYMVSNENYNCNTSYKDANGVCGYNGVHTSNPNGYTCGQNS